MSLWPGRRTYLLCALASMGFIVYGSLVPFDFHPTPWSTALAQFERVRAAGFVVWSRTDFAANVLVFVPVGYFLMAWLRTDRVRLAGDVIVGAVVAATCVALSVAVEFAQNFFPPRLPSYTDIVAESAGGTIGAGLWLVAGRTVTAWLRDLDFGVGRVASSPRRDRAVVLQAILTVYVLGFALAELMPLDVTADLGELAQKVREGRIVLGPFTFAASGAALAWDLVTSIVLWMPVGAAALLVGQRGDRRRPPLTAIVIGTIVAGLVELAQVFVFSRYAETSDVIVGAVGVAAGVGLVTALSNRQPAVDTAHAGRQTRRLAFAGLLGWIVALAAYHWMPFDFTLDSERVKTGLRHLFSAPMSGYYFGTELNAVTQILRKALLALPLGALLALASPPAADVSRRKLQTSLLILSGVAVLGVLEAGQVFLPSRYPDFADVIIGGGGLVAGFWLVRRLVGPRAPATDVLPAGRSR